MRLTAAIAALLLSACATPPVSDPDVVRVKWVRMSSVELKCGMGAKGCYRMLGNTCVVYTPIPRPGYDLTLHAILGHEVRHCFDGDFHPARTFINMSTWRR